MSEDFILIEGARQNNLKGLNLRLPLNKLIVVTGVSGSGKSSLAFDTIYSEGQRRYVETFSAYTRQFLDRMDRPRVERIEGIPPAIAIDQTNPVRTSRSTVGTMTELNDHIKLLFARASRLYCGNCGKQVRRDSPNSIYEQLMATSPSFKKERKKAKPAQEKQTILITFPISIPAGFSEEQVKKLLAREGYHRIHRKDGNTIGVVQDRASLSKQNRARIVEDLEAALHYGQGCVNIYPIDERNSPLTPLRFSVRLHCADCNIRYSDPVPNLFSFNSPIGACETCRGFGRIIDIDYGLVVPDRTKTLAQGAVKPWQTESYRECRYDLMRFARKHGIPTDVPWQKLSENQKRWVLEGEGAWEDGHWYGVRRFFDWLETKSYRMHIRVLLSKYRAYRTCPVCNGARLKPDALLWRIGKGEGLSIQDVMLLPIGRCFEFFSRLNLQKPLDEATELLLGEIQVRLRYLVDIGLGYLTLDRQSRTLSGGEVQRINLTTALGTSLVNTLFVLDEPSIGMHPRDIKRLIAILWRLCDTGNSLIVVEHDPEVIRAADVVLDMGPGPGEQGGEVVFFGSYQELLRSERSLTADYLAGRKTAVSPRDERGVSTLGREITASASLKVQGRNPDVNCLEILGACEHNLKDIDVRIPLGHLTCITGVSGSGKSTLIQDICYPALCRLKHKPAEAPGKHRTIRGYEQIDKVVLVDQSPIGRTTRSNPASYVGGFDAIRKLFGSEPLARERGYRPGTFSFNSGMGRCPTCSGSGFEHVEMQFLSDVYLRCPDCDGRRYRQDILEVKLLPFEPSDKRKMSGTALGSIPGGIRVKAKSIADVLEMTVSEACEFFAGAPQVVSALEPLRAVGLDYVKLGQPVPTLSGGEAQRLKLAGYLARSQKQRRGAEHTLFLFDEPTTGLHFADIATLLRAFRRLLESGHSVVVIEHNLDVIASADWIIDLGPEGGDRGGEVVCVGTPQEVAEYAESHTGRALRAYSASALKNRALTRVYDFQKASQKEQKSRLVAEISKTHLQSRDHSILIRHAREHNLQGIDLSIPRDAFTVVTGVSGSGKSTVAFDILFSEGQRRYLESLNAYARQFVQPATRPDVDGVSGVPPTVAIEQRTSRGGSKSTLATMTEIYHFLRLLFVKLGIQHCPDCDVPIRPQSSEAILAKIAREYHGRRVSLLAPLVIGRKGYYTDLAKWAAGKGFSHLRVDDTLVPTDNWPRLDRFKEHNIDLPVTEQVITSEAVPGLQRMLELALQLGRGVVYVSVEQGGKAGTLPTQSEVIFSTRRACPRCGRSFEELDPRLFSFNSKHGWCPHCCGTGVRGAEDEEKLEEGIWQNHGSGTTQEVCSACKGLRLRPEALAVRFRNMSIADITELSVEAAEKLFRTLKLKARDQEIARDIIAELHSRLAFLKHVGLPYLSLDRGAPTLSSGEARRIRLASQLGSNLRGVCYILDEPTIGLHARDNRMLLNTLGQLKAKGNTVVVVEHDEETIRRADHVVDLGPGGGMNGGRLVAEGTVEKMMGNPQSLTARFLRDPLRHPLITVRHSSAAVDDREPSYLEIVDAHLHNLKDLRVRIPLGQLVCITGVSGSGKSSLAQEVLYENLKHLVSRERRFNPQRSKAQLHGCTELNGWESIRRVLEVDQTPIGKTPRSCPATYVGFWGHIRQLFSRIPEAKIRGYSASRFSFNVAEGRCRACAGQGMKKIEMSFLPDVTVVCEVCRGNRFTPETLAIRFKDRTIADILAMSVDEALDFFQFHPQVHHALSLLEQVGLGYLSLGQQSPTLSGGEAQRIKLVTELAKTRLDSPEQKKGTRAEDASRTTQNGHSLYILDEPTIGLHMADVEKLIRVLYKLVDAGNTVLIIEHNLDVIAEADWIIDLGPEGGDGGGEIVAQGPPESVARVKKGSYTARFLARFLKDRKAS